MKRSQVRPELARSRAIALTEIIDSVGSFRLEAIKELHAALSDPSGDGEELLNQCIKLGVRAGFRRFRIHLAVSYLSIPANRD